MNFSREETFGLLNTTLFPHIAIDMIHFYEMLITLSKVDCVR